MLKQPHHPKISLYFSLVAKIYCWGFRTGELVLALSDLLFFKSSEGHYDLADELSDVLFVLICIANQTGIDLTESLHRNLEKKTARDIVRHRSNEKLQ